MPPKLTLALRFYAPLVLGTVVLAVLHKAKTGEWTFPVYFAVPMFALGTAGFLYNSNPERAARLQERRAAERSGTKPRG
ncbi:hypothetical protein ACGFZH_03115 [Streptomyces zaomyceticus]|uniref:hypothetical protein n=1 Tax=Streptomyces zaomyceticus TaxID=68286 RepID=UPI001675282B|nr:hypothetical protein [Streptomyces zaomyceticus]GHG37033.1 hypothetical protein GCM10018791_63310 [Streptomyces zaomyceticus]